MSSETVGEISQVEKKKREAVPRWMMTFADLMSLLFALFVLLLSFADFDKDKFMKNAGPINEAFNKSVQDITETKVQVQRMSSILPQPSSESSRVDLPLQEILRKAEILDQLRQGLIKELENELIEIIERDNEIVVRFPDTTSFSSGGADLKPEASEILNKVGKVIKKTPGKVYISGHTDNVPITTGRFRSNWDLSSERAVSVVHFMIDTVGVDYRRFVAQGFADAQPLASNDTAEDRARNRRVEISLKTDGGEREYIERFQ